MAKKIYNNQDHNYLSLLKVKIHPVTSVERNLIQTELVTRNNVEDEGVTLWDKETNSLYSYDHSLKLFIKQRPKVFVSDNIINVPDWTRIEGNITLVTDTGFADGKVQTSYIYEGTQWVKISEKIFASGSILASNVCDINIP